MFCWFNDVVFIFDDESERSHTAEWLFVIRPRKGLLSLEAAMEIKVDITDAPKGYRRKHLLFGNINEQKTNIGVFSLLWFACKAQQKEPADDRSQ